MSEIDYDRKILEMKQQIQQMEEEKLAQEKRNEGFVAFDTNIRKVFDEYGLTERDLFLMKSAPIVEWVKSVGEQDSKPGFYEDLKGYFEKIVAKEIRKEERAKLGGSAKAAKPAKPKGPVLEIGVYRNPITEEVIEKKRRNPKPLDDWLAEFGIETVSGWKQPS